MLPCGRPSSGSRFQALWCGCVPSKYLPFLLLGGALVLVCFAPLLLHRMRPVMSAGMQSTVSNTKVAELATTEFSATKSCPACPVCDARLAGGLQQSASALPTATSGAPLTDAAATSVRFAGVTTLGPITWDPLRDDPVCASGKSWSQDKEDRKVFEEFFAGPQVKRFGTVLEMGALDGLGLSNSLFFERCLQWRSILIEGQPNNCQQLFRNRPRASLACQAICNTTGTLEFTRDPGPIAGAPVTMSDDFKQTFHSKEVIKNTVTVPCSPLGPLLSRMGVRHLDFFSLDVEGAELAVLETIDFSRLTVDVMMVERDAWNDVRNQAVQKLLIDRAGLLLHSSDKLTPRSDLFFRKGFKDETGYYGLTYGFAPPAAADSTKRS